MSRWRLEPFVFAAAVVGMAPSAPPAAAAEIAPHRALYTMSLGNARNDSGVVDARGTMDYEWGETCDGWTIEQRYRLKMRYAETSDVDIVSSFVTWESKDGLRYRFNQKQTRNGEVDQEIRGEARLDGPGKGGVAEFSKPQPQTLKLEPGVMFPSAHTILLIDAAHEGENFVSRLVFDGATDENAVQVSAAIGRQAHRRSRGCDAAAPCCSGPAGACGSPFSRSTPVPRNPITSSACASSTTACRRTW